MGDNNRQNGSAGGSFVFFIFVVVAIYFIAKYAAGS